MFNLLYLFSYVFRGALDIAVTQMIDGSINVFVNRRSESISAINSHPSKGAVYMYIDHVTWKAS